MKIKCLLVDDLDENLIALSALLRRDDVALLRANSGAEALELLLVHDVALALLDVQMPDMDGFELAELMRGSERTRGVPIIFVTAGARDQGRLFKGYDLGAVDFLYKPVEAHILKNKADVFFQLYRQKQQLALELQDRSETLRLNEMFTGVLGHDLRNPLNAIVTAAHLLERRAPSDDVRETARRLVSSAKRMGRMIDGLLDLTRARLAGGIPLKRAPADLGVLIHRVVEEHRVAYPDRAIDVRQESGSDMGGDWDGDRLAQVVSNLIGNALQHGDAGDAVGVYLDGRSLEVVEIAVRNSGGIPPDVVPHLFDPFRGRQQLGDHTGLGLGLYIVQQIVHAHAGRVEVESTSHTVFRVSVPRRMPEE